MNQDKIKSKIKALLAKTEENGASKQEMEAALKKANALMLEHFISEHDLKDTKVIEQCIQKEVPLIQSGYFLGGFYNELARLFDCEYFYTTKTITFFGFEQDTELCAYFYNFIISSCLREKNDFVKSEDYKALTEVFHGRTLVSSFIKGFISAVAEKMYQLYKERQSNIPESYGLMVIEKDQQVKQQFDSMDFSIKTKKLKQAQVESQAFYHGEDRGNELNLVQGVTTTTTNQPLPLQE